MDKSKKDKRVILTMTMDDWQKIKAAADLYGLSVASFLRQSGLKQAAALIMKTEPKKEAE